jgi:hypothetical protein
MREIFQNIFYVITAVVLLIAGVFIFRFVFRFAWKFIRAALIILSIIMLAGYFFGIFDLVIH